VTEPRRRESLLALLVALALLAFAGNSLLARVALRDGGMDAASFTTLRLASGALVLWALVSLRRAPAARGSGDWTSALALFAYAALFSLAYVGLEAGAGALLLFGAVQATMVGRGLATGERLGGWQWSGIALALAGLSGLLLPGLTAPPLAPALMMLGAGVAWGAYSLRGRDALDPLRTTAGNFLRTLPMAALFALALLPRLQFDTPGLLAALASGALASGLGYAIWYTALPSLQRASAATVQLAVPLVVAVAGVLWLGEPATLRLALSGAAILGGVALVLRTGKPAT